MRTCQWCLQEAGESDRTCGGCGSWLVDLDRTAVPGVPVTLLALAQRWGIPDDAYRDDAIRAAAPEERDAIVEAIDDAGDALGDWLLEPPSGAVASDEYRALTSLTKAADLARLLRQREKS